MSLVPCDRAGAVARARRELAAIAVEQARCRGTIADPRATDIQCAFVSARLAYLDVEREKALRAIADALDVRPAPRMLRVPLRRRAVVPVQKTGTDR